MSIGDSLEGVLCLGQTGSGKTSAAGRTIALAMLNAGYGGVVFPSKVDELANWQEWCRLTGRGKDLVVFGPDFPLRYNVIDSELDHNSPGGVTHNIVSLLFGVMERATPGGDAMAGHGGDRFWQDSARVLCSNACCVNFLAKGRVTIGDMHRIILSAANSTEEVLDEAWRSDSFLWHRLQEADQNPKSESSARDLELSATYWLREWPTLGSRTRSSIIAVLTSFLDRLQRGMVRDLLFAETNFVPHEAAMDGKIVFFDLPVVRHRDAGVLSLCLLKQAFQRAILKRDVREEPRPLFCWVDEFQGLACEGDAHFCAVSRSARVANVFLSQGIASIRAALGQGERGANLADALLGNLNTRIFMANGCTKTNEWASQIAGQRKHLMASGNSSGATDWVTTAMGLGGPPKVSVGFSEAWYWDLPPAIFGELRCGGPANAYTCDSIVIRTGGRLFQDTRRVWRPVTFRQK